MLLQTKSKKGVSIMIGYILLVSFSIIMGAIIYQNLKTYVPSDSLDCPDSVSIFLKEYSCESSAKGGVHLNLTLKNNGKFNIAGYFIHATNETGQEIATIDLSSYFNKDSGDRGAIVKNAIVFKVVNENTMEINQEKISIFDIAPNILIKSIEITPIRFQKQNNKIMFVSCGNAKISEKVICPNCSCSLIACLGKTCTNDDGVICSGIAEAICPNPKIVSCGAPITPSNNCGSCSGIGTLCIEPGEVCSEGSCQEEVA